MHKIHMASRPASGSRDLSAGYEAQVDAIDSTAWYGALEAFEDANIYQTWAYDEGRCSPENLSHLVLKKAGGTVAIAQSRIVKAPLLNAGVAYVRWGPLWRRDGEAANEEDFRQAIRALRNEYACRRGLVLRLYPLAFDDLDGRLENILAAEGFSPQAGQRHERTLLLDLRLPLDDLRKGLSSHWRRGLKTAQKNNLEVVEGDGRDLFGIFIGLYRNMLQRKNFVEPNDINEFKEIQSRLPDPLKMKILLCKADGEWCSGIICSAVGKTGVYLFGATSDIGLDKRGAYLLHWTLIEALQKSGHTTYDLHGIDPQANPGTYRFKKDLCGPNARDVEFLGRFQTCTNPISYACTTVGESARTVYRRLRKKH